MLSSDKHSSLSIIQKFIDQLAIKRVAEHFTPDDFHFVSYTFVPQKEEALFYQEQPIKKIRLIRATKKEIVSADKTNYTLLYLTLDNGNKVILSIDSGFYNVLYHLQHFKVFEDTSVNLLCDASDDSSWDRSYSDGFKAVNGTHPALFYPQLWEKFSNELITFLLTNNIKSVILFEVGCGHANFLRQCIDKCIANNIEVVGAIATDRNKSSIGIAREKFAKHPQNDVVDIQEADSLTLGASVAIKGKLTAFKAKKPAVCIALSSGAINKAVLNSIQDAMAVFKGFFALDVDYVLLSGLSSILCNPTIAKRSGYVFHSYGKIATTTLTQSFIILRKQDEKEYKHYQTKFAAQEMKMQPKSNINIILSMTSSLYKRLKGNSSPEMPTTITDDKELELRLLESERKLWEQYGVSARKEEVSKQYLSCINEHGQVNAGMEHRLYSFMRDLYSDYKTETTTIDTSDYGPRLDPFITIALNGYPHGILLSSIYRNYSKLGISPPRDYSISIHLACAKKEMEFYVDLICANYWDKQLFDDVVNYRINQFNLLGQVDCAQYFYTASGRIEVSKCNYSDFLGKKKTA